MHSILPRFKQSTVQQELSAEAIHKEIKKKESKKKRPTVTIQWLAEL